jgi:hypothetical protein
MPADQACPVSGSSGPMVRGYCVLERSANDFILQEGEPGQEAGGLRGLPRTCLGSQIKLLIPKARRIRLCDRAYNRRVTSYGYELSEVKH